ncbi:unnamed protein product [Calicophoron daubneyi]|uniref:Aminomethyltransferase folate-binding domain-containing protein n=1 Tax=Calicophoron daubneyi TaxID=300641 RepID=A0AAV2TMC8_CALDB
MLRCSRILHFTTGWLNITRKLSVGLLEDNCFLTVKGSTSANFLQGLITNDMSAINRPGSFMYSLLLNVKGRIITDAFIYHLCVDSKTEEGEYLIELDKANAPDLKTCMTKYNIRRKVAIEYSDSLTSWAALPSGEEQSLADFHTWMPVDASVKRDLLFYSPDPRGVLGWSGRILLRTGAKATDVFSNAEHHPLQLESYHRARWKLGLPEGPNELIAGETLPLEANGDLSGAVSFSKGCYIGQELTARTRFTGVVRRRYVPVRLTVADPDAIKKLSNRPIVHMNSAIHASTSIEANSTNPKVRPVGWLRSLSLQFDQSTSSFDGFAILRLTDAASSQSDLIAHLPGSSGSICVHVLPLIPSWWPEDIAPGLQRSACTSANICT